MRRVFPFSSTVPALLLLTACSGGDRSSVGGVTAYPTAPTSALSATPSRAPDLSGSWNWSAVGRLTVPASVVERLFGIEPEGPITHLRCESSGTMELTQTGASFSGLATRTAVSCETGLGHVFVPAPPGFTNSLPVEEGTITGRGVHFLLGSVGGLGCPHNGAITDVEDGTATEITANGRCILPGHPQSPAPLDPPPLGTSHDTSLVATRP